MKFDEVQALLDKGFSAEFIMSLANESIYSPKEQIEEPTNVEVKQAPEPEKAVIQPNPQFDVTRIDNLEKSVEKLVSVLQTQAILNSNQPAQPPKVPIEQEIGELIAPSKRPM